MGEPVFVVVGHPNKGKSSIVSTLAQDDSVRIARESGTTIKSRWFPMQVDDQVLYTLVDTPGFQRARRALQWLQQHASSVAEHTAAVQQFVEAHQGKAMFRDECELLTPIVQGGGILYVVDGSKPFGPEYEPEMEILRWTGQPSLALINPIGQADYLEQWETALGQYFKIVRVFNAMTAEFQKRLELLHAFGQLREAWRDPMHRAVQNLERDRGHRRHLAAETVADMLIDMLTLSVGKNLTAEGDPEPQKPALEKTYQDRLRAIERKARDAVERIYAHSHIERYEDEQAILQQDLFSPDSWHLFGQSKWRLASLTATGGATAGGMIDASVGGASFLLGATIGGIVGGALGWRAVTWSSSYHLFNLPGMEQLGLSSKRLQCGPTTNRNLPYVALGRARLHAYLIARRTHAQRETLVVDSNRHQEGRFNPLDGKLGKGFEDHFSQLRKANGNMERVLKTKPRLVEEIAALLAQDEAESRFG
ncbi:GTPase Der [Candidatus Entotheonellaceae bacterium PAL068K]